MDSHILIVDDDAAIRESMCEYIGISGYQSSMASDAAHAIEILDTNTVDVVITDIKMPGMNGLELTDLIKKTYDSDVIVMTGYSENYSYEEAINSGASDFVFKPVRFEEIILRLKRVIKERKFTRERVQMVEKLQKLAITDGLTKLFNSRYFFKQIKMEVNRCNRYQHPLALLLIDIDHFKQYNDTYGHLEGDKVLIRIGEIIRSCLRKMDSAYRYGGEEFTIILPETSGEEAITVAPRIKQSVEKVKFLPVYGEVINITVSIGLTEYSPDEDAATFIQRADQAMYLSKKRGRNKVSSLFV